ncbi:GNAT family N-acetyltransferase [Xanthobacter dioxanivorans]|uniref:GNAT family N-acetyltransferase n=1 Tax=Xanthobacter dioxanivorans TaxID=2528964 RepID=A0A974PNA3_9HYPH|nr:GNAT family N-acetyltransferase [Xanthobacter dioxanivorans]QRG06722.1 GNAT family N-acetyltransferase [Xanthobacter dioxanivorans]
MTGFGIEKLHRRHAVEAFDCGEDALNRFLIRFALPNQMANASQTYVGIAGDDAIVGFYTLVVGEVRYEGAPERLTKGLARHPVPVMLLARLGVGTKWHSKGIGAGLLRDAVLRTLQVADIAGVRALVVHAKNDAARSLYERFDFQPSPTDPLHLFALIKDLRNL